ncbi:6-phosphofructokinase [Mycoplasma leonicaptivi]|uniref:6-phosphofructokinase n=1 Tax=Mycoplasma leonicaptivi TaxID=36742 RepID=UPI00047F2F76|nr:6-phosphofructokinase [Mycoplasma leonicaptivi]
MKKIAILTSGGDAPGMNNAVRAIAKQAKASGLEAYLVYEGYKGLYNDQIVSCDSLDLDSYINQGGTFIYSARFPEFKQKEVRDVAINNLKNRGIEALVVIGGDGSYQGAQLLHEAGVKTIGLPGTIDNDIASSDFTIGYDTALNTIVKAIDQIRDTAKSHKRIMIVEVMGNGCGDLALYSGIATGAEIIATAQYQPSYEEIAQKAKELTQQKNRRSIIIVVSEKCYDIKQLEKNVQETTKWDTRVNPLNHIQRGGTPSAQERILATLLGQKAVEFLLQGKSGLSIGILNNDIVGVPILEALSMKNKSKDKIVDKLIKFNKLNQVN